MKVPLSGSRVYIQPVGANNWLFSSTTRDIKIGTVIRLQQRNSTGFQR